MEFERLGGLVRWKVFGSDLYGLNSLCHAFYCKKKLLTSKEKETYYPFALSLACRTIKRFNSPETHSKPTRKPQTLFHSSLKLLAASLPLFILTNQMIGIGNNVAANKNQKASRKLPVLS